MPARWRRHSLVPIRCGGWPGSRAEFCRGFKICCRTSTTTSGAFTPVTHPCDPSSHSRYDSSQNSNGDSGNYDDNDELRRHHQACQFFFSFTCLHFKILVTRVARRLRPHNDNTNNHPSESTYALVSNEQTLANTTKGNRNNNYHGWRTWMDNKGGLERLLLCSSGESTLSLSLLLFYIC
jgi:hypothetical protein